MIAIDWFLVHDKPNMYPAFLCGTPIALVIDCPSLLKYKFFCRMRHELLITCHILHIISLPVRYNLLFLKSKQEVKSLSHDLSSSYATTPFTMGISLMLPSVFMVQLLTRYVLRNTQPQHISTTPANNTTNNNQNMENMDKEEVKIKVVLQLIPLLACKK